jgi:hypothetical protein
MTLPTSGPLTLSDIQTEFGGSNPIGLGEYYAGGGLVPAGTTGTNGAVPSSGAISLNSFYGTSNVRFFDNAFTQEVAYTSGGTPLTGYYGDIYSITSDGSNYIWVSGVYTVRNISGSGVLSYQYMTKYSAGNGAIEWQKYFTVSGASVSSGAGLAADSSGNLYYGINTNLTSPTGIAKYNSSFTLQWYYGIPQLYVYSNLVVSNSSGSMYIGGSDDATATKAIIVKISSTPTMAWVRTLVTGSSPQYRVNHLALDSSENLHAVGFGFNSSTGGSFLSFLVKYNSSGTLQWQRRLSTSVPVDLALYAVAVSSSGDVYVAGHYYDQTTTNGKIFIAKYNSAGVIQWQKILTDSRTGSVVQQYPADMKIDSSGNIYVLGRSYATGSTPIDAIYLIKFDSSGNIVWQRLLQSSSNATSSSVSDSQMSLEITTNGDLFICAKYTMVISTKNQPIGWTIKLPADGSKTGTNAIQGTTAYGSAASIDYVVASYSIASASATDAAGAFTFTSPTVSSLISRTLNDAAVPYSTEVNVNSTNTIT